MSVLLLILALAGLALGPLVFAIFHRTPAPGLALDGFVLVAVVGLVAIHIVPGAFETVGMWAIPAFVAGVFLPLALEKARALSSEASHAIVLGLAFFALLLHAALDGVGLASSSDSPSLGMAVVLHRLPVGLAVWWLVRPQFGRGWAAGVLAAVGAATIAGFGFGLGATRLGGDTLAHVIEAFVAGSLLHVLMHQSVGLHDHAVAPGRWRVPGTLGALLGVGVVLMVPHADGHSFAQELLHVALAASPVLVALFALGVAVVARRRPADLRNRVLETIDRSAPWAVVALTLGALVGHELHLHATLLNWLSVALLAGICGLSLLHQGPREFLLRIVPLGRHEHDHHAHVHDHAHDHDHEVGSLPSEPLPEPT